MILQIRRILEDCQSMFSHPIPTPEELLSHARFLILGGGTSGVSASKLLLSLGRETILVDKNPDQSNKMDFTKVFAESDGETALSLCDFLIKSPGISPNHPILSLAKQKGIPILSEIALGRVFYKGLLVGITGTDGKSTTTALTYHILKSEYTNSRMGGNIGVPFTSFCRENLSLVVLELSSYQLEDSPNLNVDVSAILNLAPDHLERHGNMQNYAEAKWKIINTDPKSHVFLNRNVLEYIRKDTFSKTVCQKHFVGENGGILIQEDGLKISSPKYNYNLTKFPLKGKHNYMNLCFAIGIAEILGLAPSQIEAAYESFEGLKFRYEKIKIPNLLKKFENFTFINDSKSTNLHSLLSGLSGFKKGDLVYLILGGIPKEEPLDPLIQKLDELKINVWVYGTAVSKWKDQLTKLDLPVFFLDDLGQTISHLKNYLLENEQVFTGSESTKEKTILFSPACASFDQYKNFEERGRDFERKISDSFSELN